MTGRRASHPTASTALSTPPSARQGAARPSAPATANRRRGAVLVAVVALLALVMGACGVSAGDDDGAARATTTTTATTEVAPDGEEGDDTDADTDTDTETETDETTTSTTEDEPPATTRPGGSGDMDQVIRDSLVDSFVQIGLTPEQAACLADTYIEMGITDGDVDSDPMAMLDAFTACGISMEDLARIGQESN